MWQKKIEKFHQCLDKLAWLPALLARISMGWIFAVSGWGKLNNLDGVIGYFESLGIPLASVQAPMVSILELVGGVALILGAGTRYFSAILVGIMAVAILTAHADDIESMADLFKVYEYCYILLLGYLAIHGAGCASVDKCLLKKCSSK